MDIYLSTEFEVFARQQVEAGAFASAEDVVTAALRAYLDDAQELRASIQDGFASLDRGEGLDGEAFMRDLIEETRTRYGG